LNMFLKKSKFKPSPRLIFIPIYIYIYIYNIVSRNARKDSRNDLTTFLLATLHNGSAFWMTSMKMINVQHYKLKIHND
jgi:hypothetical protein